MAIREDGADNFVASSTKGLFSLVSKETLGIRVPDNQTPFAVGRESRVGRIVNQICGACHTDAFDE